MVLDEQGAAIAFLVFCRLAGTLTFSPGLSSLRIPIRIRLMATLCLTIALYPLLAAGASPPSLDTPWAFLPAIGGEITIGGLLGLGARFILGALETMAVAISMSIGLTSSFAQRIEERETLPDLAAYLLLGTTALIFVADLHWLPVRAMVDSYRTFPLGALPHVELSVDWLVRALVYAFPLALQIAAPFLAFGLTVNLAVALVNKMTPQIQMYFVSTPIVILGGLLLLHSVWTDAVSMTLDAFGRWMNP